MLRFHISGLSDFTLYLKSAMSAGPGHPPPHTTNTSALVQCVRGCVIVHACACVRPGLRPLHPGRKPQRLPVDWSVWLACMCHGPADGAFAPKGMGDVLLMPGPAG